MATSVKEINLKKNGEMVTPLTLLHSIYLTNGEKLFDVLNEILRNLNGTLN